MKNRWKQNPIIWKKQNFDSIKKTNPGKESIMERRSMWSRLLAIVLAVSMVFSSQSMSVFADTLAIIQQPQDTNEKKNQPADDTSKDNQETSEESEEETTAAEEPQQSEPAEESSEAQQEQTVQMTGTINGENVNLRSEPSTSSEVLSKAQTGDVVSILGEVTGDDGNTWYEILYGQGSAFVSAEFVTVTEAESESETEAATEPETAAEEETQSEAAKKAARKVARNASQLQITTDKEKAVLNESVTLTYSGSAEEGCTLQWQQEVSDGQWMNITGQTGNTYSFGFTNANAGYSYRLVMLNADNEITATSNEIQISKKTVEELAAEYYGGENPRQTMASVSMTQKNANEDGQVKAGETLTYNISYETFLPPLYNYSDGPARLFSQYGETTITLKLPAGMNITSAGGTQYSGPDSTNTYTFDLGTPSTGTIKSFDITVVLDTNGTQEINKTLEIGKEDLQIHTSATILDRENSEQPEGTTYRQDPYASSVPEALTTTTSDDWGITKSVKNVIYTPAEGKPETVTVKYEIALGLLTDSGSLSNNASDYSVEGRAPFQTIQLTELLSEVKDRSGNTIAPVTNSVKLTENFEGGQTYILTDEQIKGTAPITINTDTCAGKAQGGGNLSGVASSAAYYTTYTVEVTYPYDKFDAEWIDNPTQASIEVGNQASLSYRFKGGEVVEKEPVQATTSLGEITEPVALTIVKKIGSYKDDTSKEYNATNYPTDDLISGSAEFAITDADGRTVSVYTQGTDGKYELLSEDGKVSVDKTSGGNITVYLNSGTYTVTETKAPVNTTLNTTPQSINLTTAKTGTLTFVNEENLGGIEITKVDAQNSATKLQGAKFTIEKVTEVAGGTYETDSTMAAIQVETGANGVVEITRLVPGIYRITETEAPEGYLLAGEPKIVTVTAGQTTKETFKNKNNASGSVTLTKYVVGADGKERVVTADDGFDGTFTLESTTTPGDTNSWTQVELNGVSEWTLPTNGMLTLSGLAAYKDGQTIIYRFKENLPEGWHAVDDPTAVVAYSKTFTLTDVVGTGTAKSIPMTNVLNGTLTLTKYFYEVVDKTEGTLLNTSGSQVERKASAGEVTFKLYQKIGENGVITPYSSNNTFQTDSNGQIIIKDLPRKSGDNIIYYYLYEDSIGTTEYDYNMVSDHTVKADIDNDSVDETLIGPFNFGDTLREGTTVRNVQQMVTVKILKYDTVGKKYITGAKISIEDSAETPVVENVTIGSTSGYIVALEPGKTYTVSEIVAPPNYILTNETVEIDLTNVSVINGTQNPCKTVTINNKPYQSLTITKILQNADGTTDTITLAGTSFDVYQFTGSGAVTADTLKDTNQDLKAGTALQLAPGTYYLQETYNANKNILDVNASTYRSLYKELFDERGISYVEVDGELYFGPYTITEDQGATGSIYNISSLGGVKVKKINEQGAALSGAELAIYKENDKGELVQQGSTQTSGTDGCVTFKDLEIYDANGDKITYYIKETKTPNDELYYLSDEELSVTLEPQTIVTTDANNKELTFVNKLYRTFTVTKIFVDLWESSFTGNTMLLSGAKIALYKWDEAQQVYIYTGQTKTTNLSGQVVFEKLEGNDYVAVEVSVPDIGISMEPEGGKEYLDDPSQHEKLTKDELEKYNYAVMDNDAVANSDTLVNEKGWTQIVVNKFKKTYDGEELKKADTAGKYDGFYDLTSKDIEELKQEDPDFLDEIEKKETPQNTSIFKLYKQEVGETTELVFNAEACEEIGTYTTGTMTNPAGEIVDGQFATDILETGKNIVYWLVETDAGVGASIIPEKQIILFYQEGTSYTNNSPSIADSDIICREGVTYPKNNRASCKWENQAEYGGGKLHLANVKFSKWAGDYEEDGVTKDYDRYTVLGGAQYELWVADVNGNLIKKVEDLTTGLENDVSDTSTEKTGVAVSTTLYIEAGDEENADEEPYKNLGQFIDEADPQNPNNPAWNAGDLDDDGNDDYYVRMAIKETYAPYGYKRDSRIYYMQVLFTSSGVETNEAYYVSEADNRGEDKENLAENQTEKPIVWAESDDHYRLINWPIDYHQVTVNQYGYDPSTLETPTGNTAEELDALVETRVPISNTAILQRFDDESDTWRDYDFNNNAWVNDGEVTPTFTTSRPFENGLISGRYRIIETGTPTGNYDMMYDGSTVNGQVIARYFTVGNRDITVNMYNPKPLDLTFTKTDLGTTAVAGITFTLHQVDSDTVYRTDTSEADGKIDFTGVMTGNYWMQESAGTTNYSAEYFQKYLASIGLSDLGNKSAGIFLGYDKSVVNGDAVISAIKNFTSYQTGGLTVKNPSLVNLTVKKVDAENPNAENGLSGAGFELYWIPFDNFDSHTFDSSAVGKKVDKQPEETNGIYTWNGLQPGVYRIHETKAPEGYDFDEDNADTWVIIKGKMNVTITGAESITTIEGTSNANAPVIIENKENATLKIKKNVVAFPDAEEDGQKLGVPANTTATFNLYETATSADPIHETPIVIAANNNTFAEAISGLERGKNYYLEEVNNEDFALKEIKVNGFEVEPTSENNRRYQITTNSSEVTVEVTNTYLWTEVVIQKVNGATGAVLSGAQFAVKKVSGQTETELTEDVQFTYEENPESKGEYTFRIRLDGDAAATYKIYETVAPENYEISNIQKPIEVTLHPGEKKVHGNWTADDANDDEAMLEKLIMPNYNGATITLTKYGNLKASETDTKLGEAEFVLYQKVNGTWLEYDRDATDENGEITFTVVGGREYALTETADSDYVGLDGIWNTTGGGETEVTEVNGYYKLGTITANTECSLEAYNIPKLTMEIRKSDASNSGVVPTAQVSVYEVDPSKVTEGISFADVSELTSFLETAAVDAEGNPVTVTTQTRSGADYSSATVEVQPGKTYLVKEDKVTGPSGYDSMITNDKDVVWYQFVTIAPEVTSSNDLDPVELKNVKGSVDLTLTKDLTSVDNGQVPEKLPSLFEGTQNLTYVLNPTVDNNTYGLNSFKLTDTGLTAYHLNYDEDTKTSTYELMTMDDGWYSIDSVQVGQSSHETTDYETGSYPIKATVTFIGFDGQRYPADAVDVFMSDQPVTKPAEAGDIKSIEIEYTSALEDTTSAYTLGKNFIPGDVEVNVVVKDRDGGVNAQSVDQIRNDSTAVVTWDRWDSTGTRQEPQEESLGVKSVSDFDVKDVAEEEAALVSISKTAGASDVILGGELTYTITVKNESSTGGAALQSPVIVDLLPKGARLVSGEGSEAVKMTAGSGVTLGKYQSVEVPSDDGEESDTAVVIELDGNLEAGAEVTLQITTQVTNAAVSHGNPMTNYAFVTSQNAGTVTDENKVGASFKDHNGENWAQKLSDARGSLDSSRAGALETVLNGLGYTHGFLSASDGANWVSQAGMDLLKEGKGDTDSSYSSTRVSTVSNGGTMDYRLTVSNSSGTDNRTNLVIMDMLPQVGDEILQNNPRYSAWPLKLTAAPSVAGVGNGINVSGHYTIYYYTGDLQSLDYEIAKEAQKWSEGSVATGWSTTFNAEAKAFIVVLDNTVRLTAGTSIVVSYRTSAAEYTEAELGELGYTNAVNNFVCHYSSYAAVGGDPTKPVAAENLAESDVVIATLIPNPVDVGGHVWIDKNASGVWDDGESIENFKGNALIDDLLGKLSVSLTPYIGGNPQSTVTGAFDYDAEDGVHYRFEDLRPAVLDDTEENSYSDAGLDASKLRNASNASTYQVTISLNNALGKFKLSEAFKNSDARRISRDPEGIPASEQIDSNFRGSTESGSSLTGTSELFYLWPTSPAWDTTKDIGLIPLRDLEITKVAADNRNDKVEGATFKVYGPYDNAEEEWSEKDDYTLLKTDENGEASASDLLWFKEYVIVEVDPTEVDETDNGYEAASAATISKTNEITAWKDGGNKEIGRWILNVPADTVKGDTAVKATLTVSNVRESMDSLTITKELTGGNKTLTANMFSFGLYTDEACQNLYNNMQASNDENGSATFSNILLQGVGDHTFYIKEIKGNESGVSYDDTVYKAVIKTEWNATDHRMQTSEGYPKYYEKKQGSWVEMDPNETPTIHNTYAASTELQIPVTKTVSGISTEKSNGDKFTFELYAADENYSYTSEPLERLGLTIQNGTASGTFKALKYSTDAEATDIQGGADTYYYVVKEAAAGTGEGTGYTKDATEYKIEVTITDNGSGTLQKAVKVNGNAVTDLETFDNSISFNNQYAAKGSETLTGTKKVDGGLWPTDETFTFGIYEDQECKDPAPSENVNQTADATQSAGSSSEGTFGFTFNYKMEDLKAGDSYLGTTTKTYYVKEEDTTHAGYEKDDSVYTVEVTITDNGNGTLSVVPEVTEKDGTALEDGEKVLTFTNTFTATGNASFTGTKKVVSSTADNTEEVLTGSIKEFTFELYSDEDCESKIGSFTNNAQGTISFAIPHKEGKNFAFDMSDMKDGTSYLTEKTFHYYVKEVPETYNNNGTGYNSRGDVYRVSITMELIEENGTAVLKQKAGSPVVEKQTKAADGTYSYATSELTFTNDYQAKGTITINASKTVDKGQLGTYEFGIYTGFNETAGDVTGNPIETVRNDGSGNITYETEITMADLLAHENGQFVYYVKETTSDGNGLTTDKSIYRMTYTATDQKDGTISVTEPEITKWDSTTVNFEEATEAVFENQYTATGTFEVSGVKEVEGNNLSAFTFGLFADSECTDKLEEASNETSGADAGKFTISHEVTIDDLAVKDQEGNITGYSESKEFTYYLKEITEDGDGYDVSDAVYKVTVTMEDNGNGTITPSSEPMVTLVSGTGDETGRAVFTNKYNAEGSYSISGTKTVENGNLIPGFEFSIYEADGETPAKNADPATVSSDDNGEFGFKLNFTNEDLKVGTTYETSREFTYYIKEVEPKYVGYTKDSTIYKLVFTVENKGEEFEPKDPDKEKLDVTQESLEVSKDNGDTWSTANTVSFVNTFTASGDDEISGKKNVEHGNVTEGFEFSIYKNFDATSGVSEPATDTVADTTVENANNGEFSFNLEFEMEDMLKEGTTDQYLDSKPFTYYIVESALGNGHVNYTQDDTIYKVDFTVTRTEENGEVSLKAGEKTFSVWNGTTFVSAPGGVSFTNTYLAEGDAEVSGLKSVTNNNLESFEFGIFEDEAGTTLVTDGTVVARKEDGTIDTSADGRTVQSDAVNGTFGFFFHYDMEDLKNGETYASTKNFTYYIKETSTAAEKPGYEMDGSIYKVTVTVTNNTETGKLDTVVSVEKKEADATEYTPYTQESLSFTNDYQPADATTTLYGHKSVTGGQLQSFKFGIYNEDGSPVTDNLANGQTQEVDSDKSSGDFQFDLVYDMDDLKNDDGSYAATRTFTYQIRETSETGNGYTVGGERYQAVVTLRNADGALTATSVITAMGSTDPTAMEFTNSYTAEGDVTIEGTKEITGANMKAFTFGIYADEDCETPLAVWNNTAKTGIVEQQIVTNGQDGKFKFVLHYTMDSLKDSGENTYKLEESFTYYIKETSVNTTTDGSYGYKVDTSVKPITVTIKDLQNGRIQADVTEGKGNVTFTNSYTAEGNDTLTGNKTVQNANRTEFTFGIYTDEGCTVKAPEENVNPTATSNAEDGTFSFDFHYTMADLKDGNTYKAKDTFTYYVKEDSQKPGYEENTTVYRVKVDVSNEADNGRLTVNARIDGVKTGEGSFASVATETLDFENTYTAIEEVSLTGTKNVLGGNQEDGFEFGIFTDEAMETLAEEGYSQENPDARVDANVVTNTNGSFEFNLHFSMNDLKQDDGSYAEEADYTFYIRELTEPVEGSGYAKNTVAYKVDYHLTDDTEGNLTAECTKIQSKDLSDPEADWQDAEAVSFTNQFNAEGSIDISAVKVLTGTALEVGDFTFTLTGDGVNQTKTNGAAENHIATVNGPQDMAQIVFDTIQYSMADLIRTDKDGNELKDKDGNLLYDDSREFVYVLEEVEPEDANPAYTYSKDRYEIHVTVRNDGTSELKVSTELYELNEEDELIPIPEEEELPLVFENQYTAAGSLTLTAEKVLNGSILAAGQFQFELRDESGNILDTAVNEADGSINFNALQYTQADIGQEYTYTISEVNNEITGVTYDETVYTVQVQVEDSENSDGTLAITAEVLNGETPVESEEGTLPVMTFTNTFNGSVNLTKQGEDGRALSGAEFTLYARTAEGEYEPYATEGNETGAYTTDLSGTIQLTNLPANDYYFVETRAPQGYVIETDANGQPRHYEFTIGVQDGEAGVVEGAVVNAALTVTNDLAQTGTIQVTKRVSRIGDDLSFVDFLAINETFYVGLFYDAEGTQPVGTDYIRRIDMNGISVSDPVTYTGLTSGTYYVLETNEAGQPIPMRQVQEGTESSYYCTVENDGTNQVTLDLTTSEEPGRVALQNVYVEFSEDYYWDATIDITKRVLKNGEEATADDTFYAGVYQMLEDGSYELLTEVELQQNDTVTVTGLGGPIGESMTYYVFETDGNGNRVSEDPAFRYAVSGEGSVTVTQDSTAGSITITNEYEEEEPTEEPSEKPTEKPSERPMEPTTKSTDAKDTEPTTTTSTKATKTGDTTDLTVELLLMAVAAVLMGTSVYARKRRRNRR